MRTSCRAFAAPLPALVATPTLAADLGRNVPHGAGCHRLDGTGSTSHETPDMTGSVGRDVAGTRTAIGTRLSSMGFQVEPTKEQGK